MNIYRTIVCLSIITCILNIMLNSGQNVGVIRTQKTCGEIRTALLYNLLMYPIGEYYLGNKNTFGKRVEYIVGGLMINCLGYIIEEKYRAHVRIIIKLWFLLLLFLWTNDMINMYYYQPPNVCL